MSRENTELNETLVAQLLEQYQYASYNLSPKIKIYYLIEINQFLRVERNENNEILLIALIKDFNRTNTGDYYTI